MGGNLTLLATCVGTATQVRADGAIVLLEEDDETSRQVDRLLTQLLRSGALGTARRHSCSGSSPAKDPTTAGRRSR